MCVCVCVGGGGGGGGGFTPLFLTNCYRKSSKIAQNVKKAINLHKAAQWYTNPY